MIRVLAVVPYPAARAPGQRYRIEQWAPVLRKKGLEVTLSPFLSQYGMNVLYEPRRVAVKACAMLRGYVTRSIEVVGPLSADLIFVYREAALLGPAWIERLLALRRPLVFDFDDAIYMRDVSPANVWIRGLKRPSKAAVVCRLARRVTVGNQYLAEFARRYSESVSIVPSTIDTDVYKCVPRNRNQVPVIGWTGSGTTVPYLVKLAPALRRLRERREFELRVIGASIKIPGLNVQCQPWRAETEPDDLTAFDVGLMPLPDDEWSRGKCGMKALQYMALGISPVVSPVGANSIIVEDGVNGFHARSEVEWIDRLEVLLDDESLRNRLGRRARETVEESYSARVHAPRVAQMLSEAAS